MISGLSEKQKQRAHSKTAPFSEELHKIIVKEMNSVLEQRYFTLLIGNAPLSSDYRRPAPFKNAAVITSGEKSSAQTGGAPAVGLKEKPADESVAQTIRAAQFTGLPVYVNPHMPAYKARVTLSGDVNVSDEFRANFNEWLRDYFGVEPFMLVAEVPNAFTRAGKTGDKAIFCHPAVKTEIRHATVSLTPPSEEIECLNY